jgi:hypothetical protein
MVGLTKTIAKVADISLKIVIGANTLAGMVV